MLQSTIWQAGLRPTARICFHHTANRKARRHHMSTTIFQPRNGFSSFHTTNSHHQDEPPSIPLLPRPNLRKVLIANRGEIACRVIRTCRQWHIPTVAVYSVADGPNTLHAQMADEAVPIGTAPGSPTESYLLQDELLRIAQMTGADAIHPGYGFLSENVSFCQRILDTASSVRWIGPPPAAMQAMASKSQAKAIMDAAGVPTTPGYYSHDPAMQAADHLLHQAVENIGFPVMIKAVMGGGGKGMRLVWQESEFIAALEACQRESAAAFGDSAVLLEKYLVRPRHVEVQVICDQHGNAVHLYERDCSLQRRHQKIIEEAPASDLPDDLRGLLGSMATRAAQAVGYHNAGTVEFLLDTKSPDQFYFCEMNTRLQVEHPISEQITGVDLVEWQLRVAAGEVLPIPRQEDMPASRGHAFEARIYAEDPVHHFLPATGLVWHHRPQVAAINAGADSLGVRVDTGIQEGQHVSVYYDPMISKLIVHDQDRPKALAKLIQALKSYQIAGVSTNIDFLIQCAQHPTFQIAGAVNTGFLEDYMFNEDGLLRSEFIRQSKHPNLARAVGSLAVMLYLEQRIGSMPMLHSNTPNTTVLPWSSLSGSWRIGGSDGRAQRELRFVHDPSGGDNNDADIRVNCISNHDGSFDIVVPSAHSQGFSATYHVAGSLAADGSMNVQINGRQRMQLTTKLRERDGMLQVRMWPANNSFSQDEDDDYAWSVDVWNPMLPISSDAIESGAAIVGFVEAPMPGKVRRIHFAVGDAIQKGDVVMVLEAMKMEHPLVAPRDGIVSELRFQVGDIVDFGAILLNIVDGIVEADDASHHATPS